MALACYSGHLTCPASTGNQTITTGVAPSFVIFYASYFTATGVNTNSADMHFGVGVSSSIRGCISNSVWPMQGPLSARKSDVTTKCFSLTTTANAIASVEADMVSLSGTGFTINWTKVVAGQIVSYLAVGGTDITNVNLLTFTCPTTTGKVSTTGMGFQPDSVIFFGSTSVGINTSTKTCDLNIGAATSSLTQGTAGFFAKDATGGNSSATTLQRQTSCFTTQSGAVVHTDAVISSMDSDGFTLGWLTAPLSPEYMLALGIKGATVSVGNFTQPTSNGTQSVAASSAYPCGMLLFGDCNTNSTVVQSNSSFFMGGYGSASSATESYAINVLNNDAGAPGAGRYNTTNLVMSVDTAGTVTSAASVSALSATGFNLNWTTTDSTQRVIFYIVFSQLFVSGGTMIVYPTYWVQYDYQLGTYRGLISGTIYGYYTNQYTTPAAIASAMGITLSSQDIADLQSEKDNLTG